MAETTPPPQDAVTVELFEAKPNRLFDPALTAVVRFVRLSAAVPCAECGRRSKHHWTMLVPFTVQVMPTHAFVLTSSGVRYAPLTPVCRAHLLAPVLADEAGGRE
jgi:hypothetical protein